MESNINKRRDSKSPYGYRSSSGYGYGSSPYGYGGYGNGSANETGESVVEKTLQDYLLIIRERFWYIALTFLVILGSVSIYTFTRQALYRSTATVQIYRRSPTVMQGQQQVIDSQIASAEDLNTQVNILKSESIIEQVANHLKGGDAELFSAPYRVGASSPSIQVLLGKNRDVAPERLSLIVDISYTHPNPIIAAKVANLFADAYIDYNASIRVDESMKAVEELRQRADDQRKKVDAIASSIQTYREKNKLVSLDQRHDIVTETLKELNTLVTQSSAVLQNAEIKWNQVQQVQHGRGSLLDLPFIAAVPAVSQLQTQVATQKIAVAQLGERYRPKHPLMIQALKSLKEAQNELQKALITSTAQVETEYQTALQNYAKAQAARATQETQSLSLDRYGLEYSNLERDYEVNEKILEQILDSERLRQNVSSSTIENQNARRLDAAMPTKKPFFPNYLLNLGLGLVGGLGIGLGLAFLVAYLDDRIKSAFDIETIVGLQILGIIPEVKRMVDSSKMDPSIAPSPDRETTEAFSTLMSSLQLKEESKNAQCILVTSTIAGEGKTFIAANLAQTYAAHGERVILIDCDLRRPAVNRVLRLENLLGIIDICTTGAVLDEVIVKDAKPNLDVIVTGGRSKNPTQVLNSKEFALMISELRKRYTKIFIDTPPIAIVSDALIILPIVDGSIYSIYFNKARRKAVRYAAQRLIETNVPNFGAVLNGLTGGIGGYYYSHYYDKSYKDYYVKHAEAVTGAGPKIVERSGKKRDR
jgi:succinoglycan biosynthesis transport protein ExoP